MKRLMAIAFAASLGARALSEDQGGTVPISLEPLSEPVLEWGIDWWARNREGNFQVLRRFANAPNGWALRTLRIQPATPPNAKLTLSFSAQRADEANGELRATHGAKSDLTVRFRADRFWDPAPTSLAPSRRDSTSVQARLALTESFAIRTSYWAQENDLRPLGPQVPFPARPRGDFASKVAGVIAEGSIGNGFLSLGWDAWDSRDRRKARSETITERWSLSGLIQPMPSLAISAGSSKTAIEPGSGKRGEARFGTLSLNWALDSRARIFLSQRTEALHLPETRTVVVRSRRTTEASLAYRIPGWNLQATWEHSDAERLRRDRGIVTEPQWTVTQVKATARLRNGGRVVLKARRQEFEDRPRSILSDPRSPYRSHRESLLARFEGSLDRGGWYVDAHLGRIENRGRAVDIRTDGLTVGASWLPTDRLSLFAECQSEASDAQSEVAGSPSLDDYWSSFRTLTLGLNWQLDPATSLSATYTAHRVIAKNPLSEPQGDTRYRQFAITLRKALPGGFALEAGLSKGRYRDDLFPVWSGEASPFRLSFSGRL